MGKIINIDNLKNKDIQKKYVVYALFVIILIYVFYSIYLILKTPNDTVVIEKGVLTQEETTTRHYFEERNSNPRQKL